jgi:hypothetical protein
MPQLTKAATYQGAVARFFRWPYQAIVMNKLDAASNRMACNANGIGKAEFMPPIIPAQGRRGAATMAP